MKKQKKKKCRALGCKVKFVPRNSLEKACSLECSLAIVDQEKKKKLKKQVSLDKQRKKIERAVFKSRKEALRPRGYYLKKAQSAVNKYIRARDYGDKCISCGNVMNWGKYGGAVDASHYRSTGSSPHMRFNIFNIHAGCVKCNRFMSGNITDYRIRLIGKIGEKKVLELEGDSESRNYNIDYLKRIAKIFNKKALQLNKRLTRSPTVV